MLPLTELTSAIGLPLRDHLTPYEQRLLRYHWPQHSMETHEVVQDFLQCPRFEELILMRKHYQAELEPQVLVGVRSLLPRRLLVWLESHDDLFEWYFMLVKAGLEDWNGLVNESFVN